MLDKLGLRQTPSGSAVSTDEAVKIASKIGYPVLVRPSFVLGGRAMELVYNEADLRRYMASAIEVTPDRPVLVDRFLEDAIEVDVDCISDGETTVIGAIMEHIEEAGIHSGDSACVIPTFSLSQKVLDEISSATKAMARELNVRGLMNVQFAVKGEDVYVLEVNPRASRTVPFVSKAIGVPLAKLAAKVMAGKKLRELGFTREIVPKHFSVKEAVFPFLRYQGTDISLGPEMKSTGEVMGMDVDLGLALRQIADGRAAAVAEKRQCVHQRERHDKEVGDPGGARICETRLRNYFDQRNGGRAGESENQSEKGFQTSRRPAQRARPRQKRRH